MKNFKIIFIILFFVIGTIGAIRFFVVTFFQPYNLSKEQHIKDHYNGILKEIGKEVRGVPDIKIDDKWIILGTDYETTISRHILIGDSLVKESGSETITVYRKDKHGVWQERVFE